MYGSRKQFVLFVVGLVIVVCVKAEVAEPSYSSQSKQSKTLNQPVVSTFRRFEENAPTLVKIFQVLSEAVLSLLWVIDSGLNVVLWVVNEAVISCSELILGIFGALYHVVKLLEAFGFGVKFVLEINYHVVSGILDMVNLLKENVHHAVTLVKITLANETEHVYETSSMALEGVQGLLLKLCNRTWSIILLACEKVQLFALWFIENLTSCFGFSVPSIPVIASTSVAAMKFFFESIVITADVISDGIAFLSKHITETVIRLATRGLGSIRIISNAVLNAITMVTHHVIFLLTWPVYFIASVLSQILYLLCMFWEKLVEQAHFLDHSARWVMRYTFDLLIQLPSLFISKTFMFISTYIPGGIFGLCMIIVAVLGAYLWRERIIFHILHLRSAWVSWRTENVEATGVGLQIENEELTVHETNEENQEPEMSSENGRSAAGQQKWKYELEKEKDKRLCVICQDQVKNILVLPCRHVCLCRRCMQEIRHGHLQLVKCPLCRHDIQSTMEVFV